MSKTWWYKSSVGPNPLLDPDTHKILWCETCPCASYACCPEGSNVKCYANIYQRQLAAGIAVGSRIDPTQNAGHYTLNELKAYVNGFAPSFIEQPYTGGAMPTFLTNTYADPATDEDELCALVYAVTALLANSSFGVTRWYYGTGINQGAADANYQYVSAPNWGPSAFKYHNGGTTNRVYLYQRKFTLASLQNCMAKTVEWYVYLEPTFDSIDFFDDQGKTDHFGGALADTSFACMESADYAVEDVSISSGYWPNDTLPDYWGPTANKRYGFSTHMSYTANKRPFGIVKYDFEETS